MSPVHITAVGAARRRAAHLLCDGEPKILSDDLALALSGGDRDGLVAAVERGELIGQNSAWVLRSRYAEDLLDAATRRGVRQYVILGAGLDSFAFRPGTRLGELRVFEVDDPPMQAWKRRRLADLGIAVPEQCRFAPCDFETTNIGDALARVGFAAGAPSFVSWLSVIQYLSRDAIEATLQWIATLAPGTEVVLTFVLPGPHSEAAAEHIQRRTGARFETFFTPEDMTEVLHRCGLSAVRHLEPADAGARYFTGRTDGMRAPVIERLVSASVA
jgi:methyltransferase (TIGR00027 family)